MPMMTTVVGALQEKNTTRKRPASVGRHLSKKEKSDSVTSLPKGWCAAMDAESGRIYYYNKRTRQSSFICPTEADENSEGFFNRTVSKLARKKTEKATDPNGETLTVSFSSLVAEVKRCVCDESMHEALDALYDALISGKLTGVQAVAKLEATVGATVAQQATLLITQADQGLPPGWLQYETAAGQPYYYNAHKRVTTWHKPTGAVPPPPPPPGEATPQAAAADDAVQMEVTVHTHNVAMSGFI